MYIRKNATTSGNNFNANNQDGKSRTFEERTWSSKIIHASWRWSDCVQNAYEKIKKTNGGHDCYHDPLSIVNSGFS